MSSVLKTCLFTFCWVLLLASGSLRAELVAVPALQHRVTDLTQTLSAGQQSQLEAKLAAFEQQKGSQVAVLIVPTTQPEAIEQYSIRVVDSWKLGREKQDDGVLVLVAKDDRKMRIEVGYGLEGAIPDLIAKRIVTEIMVPSFRQGDFYGGIDHAVEQIIRLISGEQLPAPAQSAPDGDRFMSMLYVVFIAAFVVGGILRAIFGGFVGGVLNGGIIGMLIWIFGGGLLVAIVLAIIAFFLTLAGVAGLGHMGGMGGGGYSGGSGGWSGGGGGGFGGGGASGSW
ncbi:TPM domain-containing protein [Methylotenera sp. G11]|uniref:TPM domain-containing protein n=1 Tax=Methylotenera sp. G11 TaxID=1506585 RepID=UPI00064873E8|nr:YgcG family protein [Methylotenera sp. G11]